MSQLSSAYIVGVGSYLPEKVLTNSDLEKMVDTSDEWIVTRTGVRERRIARDDEFSSDMGIAASKKALEDAGVDAAEVELILVATSSPDYVFMPNTACLIQRELGATNAAAVDMEAACTGHIYALTTARAFVQSGMYRKVLVVSTEKYSSIVNYKDRNTCVLFGDGASAAVVSNEGPGLLMECAWLGADGTQAELLIVPGGGCREPASEESVKNDRHFIHMSGQQVFKNAVRQMELAANKTLEAAGIGLDQVDWLVPHQANTRIIDAVNKRVGLEPDKVYSKCVEKYGNNSAASVAIALDELMKEHTISDGCRILMVAFGAGFTYGGLLLTKTGA